MTVRSILWQYGPRRDGSCNIKLYINGDGKPRYKKTAFHAHPHEWDKKHGRLKKISPLAHRINGILTRLETQEKGRMIGLSTSLIKFVADYVEDCKSGREGLRPGTWKKFISHLNKLQCYAAYRGLDDISFTDVNLTFYDNFKKYLRETGVGRAGVSNHIKCLKKFMQLGFDRDMHGNLAFKSKAFKAERVAPKDKIYLTVDEIQTIADLDLSSRPGLEKERDRFLVSYYLVLRYGDSVRINRGSILLHNGQYFYKNIAEKTDSVSFVPIKPLALEIIRKHNYDLSGDTNQEANRKLKVIAAMAGILTNMAEPGGGNIPKSAFVTTHTARRSAATNLLLSGVPLSEIMQLGGWKFEKTLKQYLLAGGIRMAQMSAERAFFQ